MEHGLGGVRAAGGEVVPLAAELMGEFGGAQLDDGGDDRVGCEVGDVSAGRTRRWPSVQLPPRWGLIARALCHSWTIVAGAPSWMIAQNGQSGSLSSLAVL